MELASNCIESDQYQITSGGWTSYWTAQLLFLWREVDSIFIQFENQSVVCTFQTTL